MRASRNKLRVVLSYALSSIALLAVSGARAEAEPVRVTINAFQGKRGPQLQKVVVAALKKKKQVELISAEEWATAVDRLGADIGTAQGIMSSAERVRAAVIIDGSFTRKKRKWTARLQLISGSTGEVLETFTLKSKKKKKVLSATKKRVWKKFGAAIVAAPPVGKAAPPPPPTVEDPETPPPAAKRVVLLEFEDYKASEVRTLLGQELERARGVVVVSGKELSTAVDELDADLDEPEGRVALAQRLDISAFITAQIEKQDRGMEATVNVFAGVSGDSVEEFQSRSRKSSSLARAIRRSLLKALDETAAPSAAGSSAPAPSESASESDEEAVESSEAEVSTPREKSKRGETPLNADAGFRWAMRFFDYNDPLLGELRPYQNTGVTTIHAGASWFPGAHFTSGFAANIGAELDFNLGVGLSSQTEMGNLEFSTSALEIIGSLKARLPMDENELALTVGMGNDSFSLTGAEALLPNVSYTFLRFGLFGRFYLAEKLNVSGNFAWRQVLSAGDIQSDVWFPRSSVGGFDTGVGLAYELVWNLELTVAGSYRHYFYSMNPEPGDANVAGGALDQYLSFTFGLGMYLD